MSNTDRQEIVRIDCPHCSGNGYKFQAGGSQELCEKCGGVGMLEKSMPWRPEGYNLREAGEIFGVKSPTNKLLPGDPALESRPERSDTL